MRDTLEFTVYRHVDELPQAWDIAAHPNLFLSRRYLRALFESAPANMTLHFVMVHRRQSPAAVAISQFLDMSRVRSFGERDNCVKTRIRTWAFRRFAANVLLMGNNMLTGQNAIGCAPGYRLEDVVPSLGNALKEIARIFASQGKTPHLTIWKDFPKQAMTSFSAPAFNDYYRFSTQPNMVFNIPADWRSESDYVGSLTKKYRDQYKRARKKAAALQKRQLSLDDVTHFNLRINQLYHNVAANAPFNTFYLHPNHFIALKTALDDDFRVYGYFDGENLVGFNTIIRNGRDIDTYFLGYDEVSQKTCMLYLNMLYDMLGYSIKHRYDRVIFARTALEIKSSIGAKPEQMHGLIQHGNKILNRQLHRLFGYFEPEVPWTERHPFKTSEPQPAVDAEESRFQAG